MENQAAKLMTEIRHSEIYLLARLKQINENQTHHLFEEDIESINWWLELCRNFNTDKTTDVETLEAVSRSIQDMARRYPIVGIFSSVEVDHAPEDDKVEGNTSETGNLDTEIDIKSEEDLNTDVMLPNPLFRGTRTVNIGRGFGVRKERPEVVQGNPFSASQKSEHINNSQLGKPSIGRGRSITLERKQETCLGNPNQSHPLHAAPPMYPPKLGIPIGSAVDHVNPHQFENPHPQTLSQYPWITPKPSMQVCHHPRTETPVTTPSSIAYDHHGPSYINEETNKNPRSNMDARPNHISGLPHRECYGSTATGITPDSPVSRNVPLDHHRVMGPQANLFVTNPFPHQNFPHLVVNPARLPNWMNHPSPFTEGAMPYNGAPRNKYKVIPNGHQQFRNENFRKRPPPSHYARKNGRESTFVNRQFRRKSSFLPRNQRGYSPRVHENTTADEDAATNSPERHDGFENPDYFSDCSENVETSTGETINDQHVAANRKVKSTPARRGVSKQSGETVRKVSGAANPAITLLGTHQADSLISRPPAFKIPRIGAKNSPKNGSEILRNVPDCSNSIETPIAGIINDQHAVDKRKANSTPTQRGKKSGVMFRKDSSPERNLRETQPRDSSIPRQSVFKIPKVVSKNAPPKNVKSFSSLNEFRKTSMKDLYRLGSKSSNNSLKVVVAGEAPVLMQQPMESGSRDQRQPASKKKKTSAARKTTSTVTKTVSAKPSTSNSAEASLTNELTSEDAPSTNKERVKIKLPFNSKNPSKLKAVSKKKKKIPPKRKPPMKKRNVPVKRRTGVIHSSSDEEQVPEQIIPETREDLTLDVFKLYDTVEIIPLLKTFVTIFGLEYGLDEFKSPAVVQNVIDLIEELMREDSKGGEQKSKKDFTAPATGKPTIESGGPRTLRPRMPKKLKLSNISMMWLKELQLEATKSTTDGYFSGRMSATTLPAPRMPAVDLNLMKIKTEFKVEPEGPHECPAKVKVETEDADELSANAHIEVLINEDLPSSTHVKVEAEAAEDEPINPEVKVEVEAAEDSVGIPLEVLKALGLEPV